MTLAARYIGTAPCPVRDVDRPYEVGAVVAGPPSVVEYLLGRADFEAVDMSLTPIDVTEETKPRRKRGKE